MAENILHDYHEHLPGGVTLRPGETGTFEVFLGDRRLFSKLERERFPEENEVEDHVAQILEAG